jgi:hypothetical protein
MAQLAPIELTTRGKAHRVVVFEVGDRMWSVECRNCLVRRKPGEPGPGWWVEVAYSEQHLDAILDAHLGSRPTGTQAWREIMEEER